MSNLSCTGLSYLIWILLLPKLVFIDPGLRAKYVVCYCECTNFAGKSWRATRGAILCLERQRRTNDILTIFNYGKICNEAGVTEACPSRANSHGQTENTTIVREGQGWLVNLTSVEVSNETAWDMVVSETLATYRMGNNRSDRQRIVWRQSDRQRDSGYR